MNTLKLLKAIGLLSLALSSAYAAEGDPVRILAEEVLVDQNSSVVFYTGAVVVTQGDELSAHGDRLRVQLDADNKLQRMLLEGAPASVVSRAQENGYEASGQLVDYDLDANLLVIEQDAVLNRANQRLRGDRIEYNLDTQQVYASSAPAPESGGQAPTRVEVLYQVD